MTISYKRRKEIGIARKLFAQRLGITIEALTMEQKKEAQKLFDAGFLKADNPEQPFKKARSEIEEVDRMAISDPEKIRSSASNIRDQARRLARKKFSADTGRNPTPGELDEVHAQVLRDLLPRYRHTAVETYIKDMITRLVSRKALIRPTEPTTAPNTPNVTFVAKNENTQLVSVDFPTWMIEELDKAAERLAIDRQAMIKVLVNGALQQKILDNPW